MNKVAIYCRVSTSDQTNLNQKIRLIEYVESKGYKYDLFEETESTRKTRPVKQNLLQRLRNNVYDGVVVYKLDRWARSSTELILEVKEMVDKGVSFVSLTDNIDFSTASGKLHFQILAAFAEFERSLISERTREGIRRARIQEKQIGRPKGKKDSVTRTKSGYYLREAKKRQNEDHLKGIHKPIENYFTKKQSPKKVMIEKMVEISG